MKSILTFILMFALMFPSLCLGSEIIQKGSAVIVKLGPFVSKVDGYTRLANLTIQPSSIWLSKNGGTFQQDTNNYSLDLYNGLVGFWKLNDNAVSTTVVDSSGNGNDGTASVNTSLMHADSGNPPNLNGAFDFDSGSYYVDVGAVIGTGAYTKFVWVKREGGGYNNIISTGDVELDHIFWCPPDYYLLAGNQGISNVADSNVLPLNEWHQVGVTFDPNVASGTMILYRDGVAVDSATSVPSPTASTTTYIGRYYVGSGWTGKMDCVLIYNRALSSEEVSFLYNGGTGREDLVESLTYDTLGYYNLELDANDTNTPGRLLIDVNESSALPIPAIAITIIPPNVYDSIFDANLAFACEPNLVATKSDVNRAENKVDDILADSNEIQTDLVDNGRLDLILDSILTDSNELQSDWHNDGRLDMVLDSIHADSNELQSALAGLVSDLNDLKTTRSVPGGD